jgi:hypothetical protein
MGLSDILKTNIGKKMLPYRAKKITRVRAFSNFESARSIGILFDATQTENYTTARFLAKYLQENKIKFRGMGYARPYDMEELVISYTGLSFFTEKEFSFSGIPVSPPVVDFCNSDFDMMIDLHVKPNYYLDALNAFSVAKMKLGLKNKDNGYYDFMIELTEPINSEAFVEQLKHYLSIIKT